MGAIHLLDDRLVSQIAAGEVVERPASVVKELLENSLDAGAREIRVALTAGGRRRIEVRDDGAGMDRDDALLAFDRHATSKIAAFADLERVATLGFRGEALASIAAVARVELETAVEPGAGQRVRIEGGRVVSVEPVAHPRGTTVEVASLFYNVPARRGFLKRPETELRRAVEVVQGYALAHPEVHFGLEHQGRALLAAPVAGEGSDALRRRIGQLFGAGVVAELVAVPPHFAGGAERVRGFVGGRKSVRGRRLFVYVNRRLVRDRAVLAAFYRTVRETWKSDDFPSLFLFLELPPEEVDVNVHPQKAEVRFRRPAFLGRIEEALAAALELGRGEEPAPLAPPRRPPAVPAAWEGLGGRRADEVREPAGGWEPVGDGAPAAAAVGGRIAEAVLAPPERRPVPLSGRSGEARPFRLLGQYKGSLILLEGPDGLYLIDQHVAHERLLYERLRRALAAERPASQRLLTPPVLELSPAEALRLAELAPRLAALGFAVEPLSGGSVALTALPAALSIDDGERLLVSLAGSEGEAEESEELARRLLDALAASLSCRAAVKMHHPLTAQEMEALVSELFRAEQPYACPHGRPVVLTMGDAELERRFGRR